MAASGGCRQREHLKVDVGACSRHPSVRLGVHVHLVVHVNRVVHVIHILRVTSAILQQGRVPEQPCIYQSSTTEL
jgi:hypothetical protein